MLQESILVQSLSGMYQWFSKEWQQSWFIKLFLAESMGRYTGDQSIFYRLFVLVQEFLSKLFYTLRLNRIFHNSIFMMPFLWVTLAVVVAPVLPTMVVAAAVLAGFLSLFLLFLYVKNKKLRYFPINRYLYLFILAYGISILSSVTRRGSLFGGMLTILFVLFAVVLMNAIETKKQLHVLLFSMVVVGVLVSLYGFYQFLFPAKFSGVWHDKEMFESISFRVYSTLGNPNVLGEYFLLVIPLALACCLTGRTWFVRIFYLGCSGVMLICLILTYSRGCYVGILAAIAVFMVLLDRRFIFLGLFGLLLLPFVLPETIINRFLSIGNMADSSTSYRVYIWMGTIAMLKDYWLSGIGPGEAAFNMVYPAYSYNGIGAPHSHNLFLQLICDSGIFGLLLFLLVIFYFYKATLGELSRSHQKEKRIYLMGAVAAVTGFLVQSLFDYTFYNYRVMLLFWIVVALGMLFTNLEHLKGGHAND